LLAGALLLSLGSSSWVFAEPETEIAFSGGTRDSFCMFCPAQPQDREVGDRWRSEGAEGNGFQLVREGTNLAGPEFSLQDSGFDIGPDSILDTSPEEQPSQLRPFHGRLGRDIGDLVRLPVTMDGRQWLRFGTAVLAVGAVSLFDDEIRGFVRSGDAGSEDFARTVRPIGKMGGLAFLGGSWLAGRAFHRPGLSAMAADGFEATVLSAGLITPALKGLVGRSRPHQGLGSGSFAGNQSFPSGEVTEAFAIASVVSAHAGRKWVKGLAWSLAGLTAWQRIELDAHWGSDVLAGALIGASVGRWVVRRNRPDLREGRRWSMTPLVGDGSYGVGFRMAFGGGDPTLGRKLR
jgi:membrane-associated phospholipid phosphatase